ncbi:HTH domain-containing protein [Halalkalicoccus sp. NIPERK01]|uniref:HTH domain-containing protein n=1 Tax=Halalkalicoccus sp. NIPERK01 TaxID=3053469 RepID=UPI00256F086C|nr:HTH domain-containing protein [Halalkalicoccus sp. NIPERK01]MDL5360641.1 hypothetical protein [Halalkalicoccus sp. NIPERK01]
MESHESLEAVLRLRTLAPYGIDRTQKEIIDRLRDLVKDGPLTDLDVDAWGASVRATGGNDVAAVRETVDEFARWAGRNDCSLTPAFEWRATDSFLDEESERGSVVVVLPLLCLAVYDDGTLEAVYPHRDDDEVHTIHDGVEALESLRSSPEAAAKSGEPLSSRL